MTNVISSTLFFLRKVKGEDEKPQKSIIKYSLNYHLKGFHLRFLSYLYIVNYFSLVGHYCSLQVSVSSSLTLTLSLSL